MCKKIIFISVLIFGAIILNAQNKPNVVFILADDLGNGDISFNNKDPEWFRYTPNIDKICEQGIYLKNYSAHHVCSPTRAGLLTGMHYTKVGSGSETGGTLDNSVPNVAKDFKTNGYATGAFGKWHNGYPCAPIDGNYTEGHKVSEIDSSDNIWQKKKGVEWGEGVNAYGFDKWTGYHSGGGDYFNRYVNGHHEKDWWIDKHYRPDVIGYTTDLISEAAIEFIENNKDTAFFCYVPMEAVHGPYHAKLSDLKELCARFPGEWDYIKDIVSPTTGRKISDVEELRCSGGNEFDHTIIDPEGTRFFRLIYATMIYSMDKAIGSIVDKLEQQNLSENTIVCFSSDNGAVEKGSNGIFQGSKHTLWEGGIHLPTAIYWPGVIDVDALNNYNVGDNFYEAYVQYIDFYPTLMSLTNSTITATKLDGIDFSEGLLNRTDVRGENESPYFGINSQWGVVKSGKWKLHYNEVIPNQILQLYNIDTDPGETTNLANEEPDVTKALKRLYNNWVDENNYAFSYLPVSKKKITNPTARPDEDILEVEAWQHDTLSAGFFIRFSDFSEGGEVAGDRIEFDIYVPDDSENVSGFHFSPGGGVQPYYVANRAVTQDTVNLNKKQWQRNKWIRNVVGYGNHAPIGGYANYISFVGTEPGYTHFYLDNIIVRHADGSTQAIWDNGNANIREYRYQDVKYKNLEDLKKIEGFGFTDFKLTSVKSGKASLQIKNDIEDVELYDTYVVPLDSVFEVFNNPSAKIDITLSNWSNTNLLNAEYNSETNSILLQRNGENNGTSEVTISASFQGNTISTTFNVELLTPTQINIIPSSSSLGKVYPNPTSGIINISIKNTPETDFKLEIYSLNGSLILRDEFSAIGENVEFKFDTSNLNNGTYVYRLKGHKTFYSGKIQIKN